MAVKAYWLRFGNHATTRARKRLLRKCGLVGRVCAQRDEVVVPAEREGFFSTRDTADLVRQAAELWREVWVVETGLGPMQRASLRFELKEGLQADDNHVPYRFLAVVDYCCRADDDNMVFACESREAAECAERVYRSCYADKLKRGRRL